MFFSFHLYLLRNRPMMTYKVSEPGYTPSLMEGKRLNIARDSELRLLRLGRPVSGGYPIAIQVMCVHILSGARNAQPRDVQYGEKIEATIVHHSTKAASPLVPRKERIWAAISHPPVEFKLAKMARRRIGRWIPLASVPEPPFSR